MKKILALLLAAVMCLSLVACGGTSKEPKYTPVEITMDNWDDYFEFTSTYSVVYETSEFSETAGTPEWVDIQYLFAVKDEYYSRLDMQNSTITVQISCDTGTQYGVFSADATTFDPTGEFVSVHTQTFEDSYFSNTGEHFALHFYTAYADHSCIPNGQIETYCKNFELLNIKGTLLIAE
ncbi:MAG: hypothetical protein PUA83_04665 [Clostridiales bacterium]|nr:hypothetical protein [Clostridiales bacterium]